MTTVRALLGSSLRLLGVLASGENMTAAEGQDALAAANQLLETWNNDNLLIYSINRNAYALTPGTQTYTMGPAGTLSTTRPVRIENASVLLTAQSPQIEIPINILRDEEWQAVTVKSVSSSFPLNVYPDGGFPLNTLSFWPIPAATCSVVLYTWNQLTAFASLDDTISLPKGYERALRYAMALELAPEYGRDPHPLVVQNADTAKEWLRKQNWTPTVSMCDIPGTNYASVAVQSRGYVVDP